MSTILDKYKYYDKQKNKKYGNLKKNIKNPDKPNLHVKSGNNKSPRQKSFVLNNNKNIQKSNDSNYAKNIKNDMEEMNFLLPNENDPFSRSVIFSNNKKIANNLFPSLKKKKVVNDISTKKGQKVKIINCKNRKVGSAHSVKNSNKKNYNVYNNNLNASQDFPSKFSEKYQLIEDKIIDKNYENDIDNDEMIIGTNKKSNKSIKNNDIDNSLINNITINNKEDNNDELNLYFKENIKNENNEEEYSINNIFENNKADFGIMYIDNYEKMINDDMLLLELQLLYEKILDLQNSYHEEYSKLESQINKDKKFISLIIHKFKELHKKNFNLLKIKENNESKNKLNNFLYIQKKEHSSYVTEINNKEINLWKNMLGNNFKNKNNNYFDVKNEIKELFKNIVFNNYSYVKYSLNDIENKIVINLIKKYNYKAIPEIKNKNSNKSGGIKTKKEKVVRPKKNNHRITNSNGLYENKINNKMNYNIKNNKFNSYNNYFNSSSKKKGY